MRDSLPSTSRSLPIALMRARERVMSPIREMLAKSDITEQQWRILRALSEYGEMDSDLACQQICLAYPQPDAHHQFHAVKKGWLHKGGMHRINGASASTSPQKGR